MGSIRRRARAGLAGVVALLAAPVVRAGGVHADVPTSPDTKAAWIIYLHGRIVEMQGKKAVHPEFGAFAFDAILKALADAGLEVVAEVRPETTTSEYSSRVVRQVRQLKQAGVPSSAITVAGFSKGGSLTRRASAELGDPEVGFAILAGCPKKSENLEPWTPRMAGRMLSLYDTSDEMVGSCTPAFEKAPKVRGSESVLKVGKRHGTFFEPRSEWVDPLAAFALGRAPKP
jgi:dienelactone hydrolase